MKSELCKILKEYATFETEVRCRISDFCAPSCSVCEGVCCRPEYCRENIDSPFLTLLSSTIQQNKTYSIGAGWLTSTGCALSAGRPPVCYQYSCKTIMDALPDGRHRYIFQVLSDLVHHIGKRSLGNRHLVEIMDSAQLKNVKAERIGKRLTEARRALHVIQLFTINGCLPDSALADLMRIKPMPTAAAKTLCK
jgi:hypothetical protein